MDNIKEEAIAKIKWVPIAEFIALAAIATLLPRFTHNQFITGPVVNATLFLAAYFLGTGSAIALGLIPSLIALSSGLLPAVLAPVIPFIMIGNIVLIITFNSLHKINEAMGILAAAIGKYLFLVLASFFAAHFIFEKTAAAKTAASMLSWPQLVTALAGGFLAYGVILLFKRES